MKKFLSLLAALSIVLSSTATAVYIPQDVRGTEFEKDVELLINLGFVEYTEDGMMKPYSRMTRADYAVLTDNVLKDKGVSEKDVFLDVDKEHYARNSINRLYEYGYISGDGNACFRPDDYIKYSEALKIMVSILGYDIIAKQKGGYPNGYTAVASEIGITKGVAADGEYISRGNAMRLLVNSFEANPVEIGFSGGDTVLKVQEDRTMLSEMAEIYYVKDCVNANSDYAVSGNPAKKGHLYIGTEEMLAPSSYDDFVGYQVECWYRENDNDENEILFLRKLDSRVEYLKVDAKDIIGVDGYACKYYNEKEAEKKVKFGGTTVFILNGKRLAAFDDSMLNFKNGWVEFIDNDSDGISDVVKINNYFNIVVETVTDEKIYSKYSSENSIELEDTELKIFDDEGNAIALSDIAKGDVLSVFLGGEAGEAVAKLIRSRKTVKGTVTGKNIEGGVTCVKIGYTEYTVYDGFKTLFSNDVLLNDNGEFLLDAYEKIVSVKDAAASDYMPGLLINVKKRRNKEYGDYVVELKMSTTGGVVLQNVVDKVRLDAIRYTVGGFDDVEAALKAKIGEVILYKLNSKGYISSIDTTDRNIAGDNDDRLVTGPSIASSENLRYQASTRVIEGRFPLDEKAKMFIVPSNISNAEDSQFQVKDVSNIGDASYISGATTYKISPDKMTVDYIVMQGSTKMVNHQSDIAIVEDISVSINKDDEPVNEIRVNVYGKEKTLYTKDMEVLSNLKYLTKYSRNGDTLVDFAPAAMPTVKRGDIIKYSLDASGAVDAVIMVYSADTETMHSRNPYHDDFHEQGYRYVRGKVTEKYGEYVVIDTRNECHRIGNADIYEVNTGKKDIMKKISIPEIKVGDTIIVLMGSGKQIMTLLYK